jgi:hypothetical protein
VLLGATACQDLIVDNRNNPPIETLRKQPKEFEGLIGGSFTSMLYPVINGSTNGNPAGATWYTASFVYASAEQTATLQGGNVAYARDLPAPRRRINNASLICNAVCEWGPRTFWDEIGGANYLPREGLMALNADSGRFAAAGVYVPRMRAFAKFVQGWAWGYAAMFFDSIHTVTEFDVVPGGEGDYRAHTEWSATRLVEWKLGVDSARWALDEAIRIAEDPATDPVKFAFPEEKGQVTWFGTSAAVSKEKFAQMANTLAARILVLSARDPAGRAALPWDTVLAYTEKGVREGNDYRIQLSSSRASGMLTRMQGNTTGGTNNGRWNYHTIGMADQPFTVGADSTLTSKTTSNYRDWISKPFSTRERFNIVTPDRRITGTYRNGIPNPTSDGTYTCYRADNNGFVADRGSHLFSAYQFGRHRLEQQVPCRGATGTVNIAAGTANGQNGDQALITARENDLLMAEALLHLGRADEAISLLNKSRAKGGLPDIPAGATVVPTDANGFCVPRQDDGSCGTLMTALRYERMLELAGQDVLRGYTDSRGFGMLEDGAFQHLPVPGNVVTWYKKPYAPYSFGGVVDASCDGTPAKPCQPLAGSAKYAPVN